MFRIDLHNHTTVSSPCSSMAPEELISAAIEKGFYGVAVTEHNHLEGGLYTAEIGKKYGIIVFPGVEVRTSAGDVLVFGIEREEDANLEGISIPELRKFVDSIGGVMIPAHPLRKMVFSIGEENLIKYADMWDAVECWNGNSTVEENARTKEIAERLGKKCVGGSDAHSRSQVGRCWTEFEDEIKSVQELVWAVKMGRFRIPNWKGF